jgi:hypothetical protein
MVPARMDRFATLLLIASVAACTQERSKKPVAEPASEPLLAPAEPPADLPPPSGPPHALRYAVAAAEEHYLFTTAVKAAPGAPIDLDTRATLGFRFEPTGSTGRRALHLTEIALDIHANRTRLEMTATPAGFAIRRDGAVELDLEPGQKSPTGVTLEQIFDEPMHYAKPTATGPGEVEDNRNNFLVKSGMVDFSSLAVFAFPSFPDQPVRVGESWTVTRNVPTSSGLDAVIPVDLTYGLERVEDCEGGRCAVLRFDGDSGARKVTSRGHRATAQFRFRGTAWFHMTRGSLDRSSFGMELGFDVGGTQVPMRGHYELARQP